MENNQGSIGIGAMIVFIALILVAAVASAVIIQTAETLQQNAQSVGDDTQDEIAGKVQIHAAFYEAAGLDVYLIFSLAPGSGTVLTTAIKFQTFCREDGNLFVSDAGDFDDEIVTPLNGVGGVGPAVAGGSPLSQGTKYYIPLSLVNCAPVDVNTNWVNNLGDGTIALNIHVDGGGSTQELLDVSGTQSEGSSIL